MTEREVDISGAKVSLNATVCVPKKMCYDRAAAQYDLVLARPNLLPNGKRLKTFSEDENAALMTTY
jgi:hypothetical protein